MQFNEFFDAERKNRVQILGVNIFRVTHFTENQTENRFIDPPWYEDVLQKLDGWEKTEYSIDLKENLARVKDKDGRIRFEEIKIQASGSRRFIELNKSEDELLYGWGEWFNQLGRKNGRIHLHSDESPEFLQGRQTYSPIPLFISSNYYLFFLLNSHASDWIISRNKLKISPAAGNLDFVIVFGDSPRDLIQKYTELTGRPRLIPKWGFGLWATSYPQENQFKVLQFVRAHRERQIPLDVLVLDYHWEERFHNFQWRKKLFPDPEQMIADLKRMDIKLGLIFTPFLNYQNQPIKKIILNFILKNIPKGCEHDDERASELYDEARKAGFLAHDQAEWWFGKGGIFDFTNPQGADWWNVKLRQLYKSGIALFKNDDGEYLPEKAHSHNGMTGTQYHNMYGFYYGKALYEGMENLDDRRGLIYSRSVWAGSQRYPAIFLGDQHPDFKNILKTLCAGLNMSLAGFAYWGADILGLDGKTTPETHMRYTQWAIFSPIARYFYRPEQIDATRHPWLQPQEVETNFRDLVNLRYRLLPYYYSCAWTAYKTGIPIIRPIFMEFPQDAAAWTIQDQVMIGDAIMLAPVVTAGAQTRMVYLPNGEWYDYWKKKKYDGGKHHTVDAPLNKVPLFVKSGSILSIGPEMAFIPEKHAFNQLELHFWGMREGSHSIYDDDGITRKYLSGSYVESIISSQMEAPNYKITIMSGHNGYHSNFEKRIYKFVLHDFDRPVQIKINERLLSQFIFDEENRNIHFVLEADVNTNYLIDVKLLSRS
jgi:alpha-glucosidase (family GH31 glycosyl hydrolase)